MIMSLCPIVKEKTFTFTGSRADDGGQPEELEVFAVKYVDSTVTTPDAYDKRLDDDFTFPDLDDGVYQVVMIGALSGLLQNQIFIQDHDAKKRLVKQVKDDVANMMCGQCACSNFIDMYGLLQSDDRLNTCYNILEVHEGLKTINSDCGKKVACKCGC